MTCREKLKIEHPYSVNAKYFGGCVDCPDSYGYLECPDYCEDISISLGKRCTMCWDREIPENKNNNKMEENEMNETSNRTMTREDLYNEINQKKKEIESLKERIEKKKKEIEYLKERIEKLAKYEKYDESAAECYAMKDSFVRAGFTEEQAFTILLSCLKAYLKFKEEMK